MSDIKYQAEIEIKLDWSEMDLLGHINNVPYFKFAQASRINFMQSCGVEELRPGIKIGPILAKTSSDFHATLHFPDTITVKVRCMGVGNSSIKLCHHIYNSKGVLVAEINDVLVLFNYEKNTKVSIPADLKQTLQNLNVS